MPCTALLPTGTSLSTRCWPFCAVRTCKVSAPLVPVPRQLPAAPSIFHQRSNERIPFDGAVAQITLLADGVRRDCKQAHPHQGEVGAAEKWMDAIAIVVGGGHEKGFPSPAYTPTVIWGLFVQVRHFSQVQMAE
jgi:hypothetical protein